jgi:phage-related protein (TIGR01555 family)
MTGLGATGVDKSRAARYLPVWRVLDQELTSLYNGSDIAAKIIDNRPEEMFRRGFEPECDGLDASEVEDLRTDASERLELEYNFREGKRWARLYGGALLCMNIDDGRNPWEPLDEENIRSFDSISLVDRRYAYVQSQYSGIGGIGKYGRPQIYLVSDAVAGYGWDTVGARKIKPIPSVKLFDQGARTALWHETRVIRFDGNPADIVTRQNLAGWSWSVLQRVYDAMRQFDGAFDSAAYLLQDASQGVFKLQGMLKAIGSGKRAAFEARLLDIERSRSVMRGIALDASAGEDFTRVATPFSGIPDLLDRMMLRLACAADEPATKLFGMAPAGLNATGEADLRKWYGSVESEQMNRVGPQIARVLRLLSLSRSGPIRWKKPKPPKWVINWKPLWSPTDKELSETRKNNADRDVAYINAGVVKPEEVAVDLGDVYPNLDVKAREEVLEAGLKFDPYENEPPPEDADALSAAGAGEPLTEHAPVALLGVSGQAKTPPAVAERQTAQAAAAQRKADREDRASAFVLDALLATREDAKAAGRVFAQLLEDYPAKALGWVLAAHWDGPVRIATDDIDSSGRQTWRASHEDLTPYVKRIEKNGADAKPIILVKPAGSDKYIIVDGHHRFLAFEKLGQPVIAYVADVHVKNGPWDELHSMQKRGSSKSSFLPSRLP